MILSRSRVRSHRLPRCARLRHYYGGMPAIACATAAARAFSWGMRSPGGSSSASCKITCRSGATLLWKSSHYPSVSAAGRRFVDEALSSHDFVLGMYRSHASVPTIPAWLVCDRTCITKYGLGRVPPGRRSLRRFVANGYLVEGNSLADLGRAIKVD